MTFDELAASIEGGAPSRGGPCRVVGVDGMSGAGKTGFARRLARTLGAPTISTDDFVPGWNGLEASIGLLVAWILRPLTTGGHARWQRYDWIGSAPAVWVDVPSVEILVIEGCGVGAPPAAGYLSFLVWLDTPEPERRRRLRARGDWETYAPYVDIWARQDEALQSRARTPARADLVVDGRSFDPRDDRRRVEADAAFVYRARDTGEPVAEIG
jgi:hypothetical protein